MLGKFSKVRAGVLGRGAWLAAAIGATTVIGWADPARACSTSLPPVTLDGYPMNGDADVPVDVVPVYDAVAAQILDATGTGSSSFTLRSSSGELVRVTPVRTFVWSIELIPERELEPNTAYTLEATLEPFQGPTTIVMVDFHTGAERAAAPSVPTDSFLQHYRLAGGDKTSCSPPAAGTCIAFTRGTMTATFVDEFDQEHEPAYLYSHPTFTNLSGIDQGTNFKCVKLRERAKNGVVSEPLELCGAGAPVVELEGDKVACTVQGVTGNVASGADGCSIAPPGALRRAELHTLVLALALASVLARRRARIR